MGEHCKLPQWGFGGQAPKILAKCKKMVYSLTLFGVRYKLTVTLTTFTVNLKNVLWLLNQFFLRNIADFSCQERKICTD